MAAIDSLLNLVERQGANELRVGTDREPQMLADGAPKRLVIPKTSMETLRELLGEILNSEREKQVAENGRVQMVYEAPGLGPFRVTMTRRGPAWAPLQVDAVFLKGTGKTAPAPPAVVQSAPTPPTPPTQAAQNVQTALPTHLTNLPSASSGMGMPQPPTSQARSTGEPLVEWGYSGLEEAFAPTNELTALLSRAHAQRATDVHMQDGEVPVARVDGRLRRLSGEEPVSLEKLFGVVYTEAKRRFSQGISTDLSMTVAGVGRVRLNLFRADGGACAAVRLLAGEPPTFAELGSPIPFDDLVELPHGLVIACGATGSGKSTTLASLVREALAKRPGLVVTLEDPIEYTLASCARKGLVRQRQVGRDVRDFPTGLRDALREDPDILLIGEMRDPVTISLALTAAETGHLVLASLHSRNAASAVDRIVDVYPAERQQQVRVQLADSLRAVVAQRLVPKASGEGRALAVEVMRVNHAIANAIRESKSSVIQSAVQSGRREGMLPLERCLADLVQKRVITLDAARAAANDPEALKGYVNG
ncbi:MAG: PilT/PilU family type 4a pilus ATPase [Polyangiaceae bacterium]|nr:PilT/PilU family type 4a pilus ATPase [Polyangiaceae bacterium]